ncbi:solanesyl diphosphate synthase 3, chloroplastic/mitochondrial [Gossypium hirsutum]|uniref:Solanesyl diphosphate synthase 3, chloroplastic/mitochondrial n=1 Tax=Gossypium hirsutum TaxID=3635 RepID=A0ABM3A9N2_GOSHI|nr:solanesyl diphosphate synthase 3, chloroplastic/mitochondrial-like [Gossypium hirsutum]
MALSSDQTPEVAMSAFEYDDVTGTSASLGKGSLSDIRQGIVTAPILFAMEEFPRLKSALEYLWKSRGIQRTKELAIKHANLVAAAIDSLPESSNIDVTKSRHALINLTRILVTRNK